MLGFRIRYLRQSVVAADIRSGSEKDVLEWPPHPDRLFCALVQAWSDLGCPEQGRRALEWLEALPAPLMRYGGAHQAKPFTQYVPVNDRWSPLNKDEDEAAPCIEGSLLGRIRQPRSFARASLADDTVEMWWPEATPDSQVRLWLATLAGLISYLGHSSSLVAVEVFNGEPPAAATIVPDPAGDMLLRIPYPGRLAELCRAHEANQRPPVSRWATYSQPVEAPARAAQGFHGELVMFRLKGEGGFLALESTARVISVWRSALMSASDQPVPEVISGHAPDSTPGSPKPSQRPHLALLPVPDVGHPFAGGHLLGLAAALPVHVTPEERVACLRTLARVRQLTLGSLGVWSLEPVTASQLRYGLRPQTWQRPSKVWASVTPLVFGRYPDDLLGDEAARFVAEACEIAGFPRPVQASTSRVSWVLGVPPAHRFPPLPSRPGKPRRAHIHVHLVFDRPVMGPVLVGAGRHVGYGLFRQLEEAEV